MYIARCVNIDAQHNPVKLAGILRQILHLTRRRVVVFPVQRHDLQLEPPFVHAQELSQQQQHDHAHAIVQSARCPGLGVYVRPHHDLVRPLCWTLARHHIASCGWDALSRKTQLGHLSDVGGQTLPLHIRHIDRGNVEVAVFDQREGIDAARQFRVASRRRHDCCRPLGFQRLDDALVVLWVVEHEVLRHELLYGQFPKHQQDFASRVHVFQFALCGDSAQFGAHITPQRVRAHQDVKRLTGRSQLRFAVHPVNALEFGAFHGKPAGNQSPRAVGRRLPVARTARGSLADLPAQEIQMPTPQFLQLAAYHGSSSGKKRIGHSGHIHRPSYPIPRISYSCPKGFCAYSSLATTIVQYPST